MSADIKYPLAKETINGEDIDALCSWLKSYPRLTMVSLLGRSRISGQSSSEQREQCSITQDPQRTF